MKKNIRIIVCVIVVAALTVGFTGCSNIQEKYNIYQNAKWQTLLQDGWYPYQGDDSYGKDASNDDKWIDDDTENSTQEAGATEHSDDGSNKTEVYASDLRYKTGLYHTNRTAWTAPTMCNDIYDIAKAVDSYVLAGCRDELKLYINDVADSDIKNMNDYMTQSFGWGDQYLNGSDSDGDYITIDLKYEDSYYVYMYIVYEVPIPEDNSRALAIYNILQAIYKETDLTKFDDFYTELFYHDVVTYVGVYNDAAADSITNGEAATEKYGNAFTVYGTLVDGSCVCEGYAKTLDLLFRLSGMESYYVTGKADTNGDNAIQNSNDDAGHAWNIVSIDGDWYQLDVTWDDSTELKDALGIEDYYMYFNISDEVAGAERTWDTKLYPECNSMDMNYYIYTGRYMQNHLQFSDYLNNQDSDEKDIYDLAVADYSDVAYDNSEIVYGENITDDYTVLFVNR